jgi:hypothetical protein
MAVIWKIAKYLSAAERDDRFGRRGEARRTRRC